MPRQVIVSDYGDLAGVRVVDVPSMPLGAEEIRISVKAAGMNPSDWKAIVGLFGQDRSKLPLRPGAEIAGVVIELGSGVNGFNLGDPVLAYRVVGGWAEEVVASKADVFHKPETMPFDDAAGLLLAGTTAWHLVESVGVTEHSTVLVSGGSGAVGRIAVQLALHRGAHVVATSSEERLHALATLGAVAVPYGENLERRLREAEPAGFDVAIDTSGNVASLDACLALTEDARAVATVAGFPYATTLGVQLLGFAPGGDPGTSIRDSARPILVELASRSIVGVEVSHVFSLEHVEEALVLSWSGSARGKLILRP